MMENNYEKKGAIMLSPFATYIPDTQPPEDEPEIPELDVEIDDSKMF